MKKIDKRSKLWREMSQEDKNEYIKMYDEFISKKPSEGLGDDVEKILHKTGIKKLVKSVFGEDCGCDERKAKLNELVRYKVQHCLTEEEYNVLDGVLSRITSTIHGQDQRRLLPIYNRVFGLKQKATNCSICWKHILQQLRTLHSNYKEDLS